jgi:hypothetical protein
LLKAGGGKYSLGADEGRAMTPPPEEGKGQQLGGSRAHGARATQQEASLPPTALALAPPLVPASAPAPVPAPAPMPAPAPSPLVASHLASTDLPPAVAVDGAK